MGIWFNLLLPSLVYPEQKVTILVCPFEDCFSLYRLHYTNKLRENEGGIFMTGVAPSTLHFIPPYQKEYKTAGYCSLDCTKEVGILFWSFALIYGELKLPRYALRSIRALINLAPYQFEVAAASN